MKCALIGCVVLVAVFAPSAFAEDAYIESDGTQYIVTDCYPTDKVKVVCDFQIVAETASKSILGNKDNAGTGASFLVWQNAAPNLEGSFTSESNGDIWSGRLRTGVGANRYVVEIDYAAGTFVLRNPDGSLATPDGGVKKPAGVRRTGTASRPLSFFASTPSWNDAGQAFSKMRLYSAQVYEDGRLVRDYVPCRKGDQVGLCDRQSGRFLPRALGNALACGGDIKVVEDDPYVELDGTDYIQTNYLPWPDTRLDLDFALTDATTTQQFLLEAGSEAKDDLQVRVYMNGGKGVSWSFADANNYTTFPDNGTHQIPVVAGRRQQSVVDGHAGTTSLGYDGVMLATNILWTTHTVPSVSAKMRLFHNRFSNIFARGRIYGLRISEGGVPKHDYQAVKENGVAFLRDRITGQTLHLTRQEPYVSASGGQMVVLDYRPNGKTVVEVEVSHIPQVGSRYIFGADNGANTLLAWVNGNATDPGIEFNTHNCWSWRQVTGAANLATRRSLIVDVPNSLVTTRTDTSRASHADVSTGGRAGYTKEVGENAYPIALFNANGSSPDIAKGMSGRIYRVTVKEDGEVVRLYEPYVKDGVVGFRDAKTGNFFAGLVKRGRTQVNALGCGGAIAREGTVPEAYIESDQTQYILTDYLPTAATRVEIDFQLTKLYKDFYLFGCNATPNWEFYVNSAWGFSTICHTGWATQTTAEDWANLDRTRAVVDRARGTWSIYRGTASHPDFRTYGAASSAAATVPFGIFGRQEADGSHYPSAATTLTGGMTPMRVYSFRAYENDRLALELLPCRDGEVTGLRDTVSGKVYTSAEGNPFVVGGKGYTTASGQTATFATALGETAKVGFNGTKTLGPVYAPGAVRYVWEKDGEVIADAEGPSLDIAWQKKPATATVAVKPVYNVYGIETEGEASACTVAFSPATLVLVVR